MTDTSVNRDPNARVLDYGLLKVTVQTKSSHRLPTESELYASFSKYGDCVVDQIGKSNQFMVRYRVANSGFAAARSIFKRVIGDIWTITSIKYGWSCYCSSLYYPPTSNLSICSKGSKCEKVHRFKQHHEAFTLTGNPITDKAAFCRFKQDRMRRCRNPMEIEFVEDIHDFHNMEGITIQTPNANSNQKVKVQSHSNSSSVPHPHSQSTTNRKQVTSTISSPRTRITRRCSIDSVDSSSSSCSSSSSSSSNAPNIAMQPRPVPVDPHSPSKLKQNKNNNNNKNPEVISLHNNAEIEIPKELVLREEEEQKKKKIRDFLQTQLRRGVSPNTQIMQKSFVPVPTPPPPSRGKRRQSPPSNPSALSETRSNISFPSQRSARSTVIAPLDDLHAFGDGKTLDYSSSSSSSSSPVYPVKRGVYSQSNVEYHDQQNNRNRGHQSRNHQHQQQHQSSRSKMDSLDWNALNEEESKSSSVTPPNQFANLSTNQRVEGKEQNQWISRNKERNARKPPPNLKRKMSPRKILQPLRHQKGSQQSSVNSVNSVQSQKPKKPNTQSSDPRTPTKVKGLKVETVSTPNTKSNQNNTKQNKLKKEQNVVNRGKKSLIVSEEKVLEDWDRDISCSVRSNSSNSSADSQNTSFVEATVLRAINSIIDQPKNGIITGSSLTKAPLLDRGNKGGGLSKYQGTTNSVVHSVRGHNNSRNQSKGDRGNVITLNSNSPRTPQKVHKHSIFASNTKHQTAFAPSSPIRQSKPFPQSLQHQQRQQPNNMPFVNVPTPNGMNNINGINGINGMNPRNHSLSNLSNPTLNPRPNALAMGMMNAPPFIPTAMMMNPPPSSSFSSFIPSLPGMTGNLMAGTLQPVSVPIASPPAINGLNASPPVMNGHHLMNQNMNNMNPHIAPNQISNASNHNHRSIATTSLSDHKGSGPPKHSNHPNHSNQEYEERKKSKLQMLAQPLDRKSSKYQYQFSYDLCTPTKLKDYHWVCYHYRSGDDYSCRFGNQCRWRHYDFEHRRDIKTSWDAKESVTNASVPGVRQMKEARELRAMIGKQWPYVFDKNDSLNPFIANNPTPPSTKKRRIKIHEQLKKEEEDGDGGNRDKWVYRAPRASRKILQVMDHCEDSLEDMDMSPSPVHIRGTVESLKGDEAKDEEEEVQITPDLEVEEEEEDKENDNPIHDDHHDNHDDGVQVLSAESIKLIQREVEEWMKEDEIESDQSTPDIPAEAETIRNAEEYNQHKVTVERKEKESLDGHHGINGMVDERVDLWCKHVHNAENAKDQKGEDVMSPLVKIPRGDRMIRCSEFSTLLALMTPFNSERNHQVDYYLIGKLASQQLRTLIAGNEVNE